MNYEKGNTGKRLLQKYCNTDKIEKVPMCLIKHYAMKVYGGVDV
jgi:hypothetical protein